MTSGVAPHVHDGGVIAHDDGWNPITWTEWAMNEAEHRLTHALWHDPHVAYAAAGEVLWWICALDSVMQNMVGEEYEHARKTDGVKDPLKGLHHARNRFAHHGTRLDYVDVDEVAGDGGYEAHTLWKWQPLPPAQTNQARRGEAEYAEWFAGKQINPPLNMVFHFLRSASRHYVEQGHPRDPNV